MKKTYLLILVSAGLLQACTEKENNPISPATGKPGQVTEVAVVNEPGGAVISYRIPNQAEVISVKAVYTLSNGKSTSPWLRCTKTN